MKLRIQGDSLRLRVTPSEVNRLLREGRVAETVHFGTATDARLTYALESCEDDAQTEPLAVRYSPREVAVLVPALLVRQWGEGEETGLYGHVPCAGGQLAVAVEKDFACLDQKGGANQDVFPNPRQGTVC